MTEEELRGLIEVLDAKGPPGTDRRKHERTEYRKLAVLVLVVQPGGDTSLMVLTENISHGGIAFKHQSRLEPGTPCKVKIRVLSWGFVVTDGKIARCRHLEGGGYEIGLQFDRVLGVSLTSFFAKLEFKDPRTAPPTVGPIRRRPAIPGDTPPGTSVNP
jgi:hypothetical protein